MSKQLQLLDELDDKQREFFQLLMDPTSPHFSDVPKTSEMVFGDHRAGEVIMSSPAGRAWRELHLQRDRDGVATLLLRIAYGETARRTREIVYAIRRERKAQRRARAAGSDRAQPDGEAEGNQDAAGVRLRDRQHRGSRPGAPAEPRTHACMSSASQAAPKCEPATVEA